MKTPSHFERVIEVIVTRRGSMMFAWRESSKALAARLNDIGGQPQKKFAPGVVVGRGDGLARASVRACQSANVRNTLASGAR
jgi:hypothetical protein